MIITMSLLIISTLSLLCIFLLNLVVGMYYGFGVRHYWFFQLLHVLGGFFVAMFFWSFTDSWTVILVGVAIVTISWESLEIAIAKIPSLNSWLRNKLRMNHLKYSWWDGAFD